MALRVFVFLTLSFSIFQFAFIPPVYSEEVGNGANEEVCDEFDDGKTIFLGTEVVPGNPYENGGELLGDAYATLYEKLKQSKVELLEWSRGYDCPEACVKHQGEIVEQFLIQLIGGDPFDETCDKNFTVDVWAEGKGPTYDIALGMLLMGLGQSALQVAEETCSSLGSHCAPAAYSVNKDDIDDNFEEREGSLLWTLSSSGPVNFSCDAGQPNLDLGVELSGWSYIPVSCKQPWEAPDVEPKDETQSTSGTETFNGPKM